MNSCMWATVHLSQEEDDFKRIVQNLEVQKIQTSSKRCKRRSATSNSVMKTSTDFSDQVDWTDGHWRNDSSLDKRIADQFRSKVYVFSDSVLCLDGNDGNPHDL